MSILKIFVFLHIYIQEKYATLPSDGGWIWTMKMVWRVTCLILDVLINFEGFFAKETRLS